MMLLNKTWLASKCQFRDQAASVPITLKQWGVPAGIAPSGTIGANGALTLGTGTTILYSFGIWWYFPAEAVYAGSVAGFYWCKMSSLTVGVVYDTILDAATQVPYVPATDVPVVDAGPGAYTGVTTTHVCATVIVPGGAMGPNGRLRTSFQKTNNGGAGTKSVILNWGGTDTWTGSITANLWEARQIGIANRGVDNVQLMTTSGRSEFDGSGGNFFSGGVANTAADVALQFKMSKNTATDLTILETVLVHLFPAG